MCDVNRLLGISSSSAGSQRATVRHMAERAVLAWSSVYWALIFGV